MSYDLVVFGADTVLRDVLAATANQMGARLGQSGTEHQAIVERQVRGSYDSAFTIDGPFRVDREDLPEVVAAGTVGMRWTWQLTVGGSAITGIKLAKTFSKKLAETSRGVAYDPQDDVLLWPRNGTRAFTPPAEEFIDVIDLEWFLRREDATADLPEILFDTAASRLPEALPRRFGGFEPLQHRLDEEGRAGFVAAWRDEKMMLFWKTQRPCLGGSMFDLGDDIIGAEHAGPHPVGSVSIQLDRRALLDDRWREDVVHFFTMVCERLPVFYACSRLERRIQYRLGNLAYGPNSETPPGLAVGSVWMGLPDHAVWLAWYGQLYRPLVGQHIPEAGNESPGGGILVRESELPPDQMSSPPHIPRELVLNVTVTGSGSRATQRAIHVPEGL